MKRLVTIENILAAVIGGIGYGVGYIVPEHLGFNIVICFICCFAVGLAVDEVAEKILFNTYIQKNKNKRNLVFAGVILFFVVAYCLVELIFGHSLWEDVAEELGYAIIPPVLGFCFSFCVRLIKRKQVLKKYGSGESGFVIDKKVVDNLKSMIGENKKYTSYAGNDPVAKTVTGSFIGKKDKNKVSFLGIPYAKAERWEKAVQLEASEDYYEAYYYGNSEIQPDNEHNIITELNQGEDCLNLNIGTSKFEPDAKKPVFVYFHGGDGRYGGSANPVYHLENIVKAIPDAVFVSVNYRFGVLGVIDFSSSNIEGIEKFKDSTALSLLDQIESLKWIRDNIAAFGGDPENITVAGDSAGGTDICLLSVMKEAKGLFKRAFIMCATSIDAPIDNTRALSLGEKLIEEFDVKSVSDLSSITLKQIKDFTAKYYDLIELSPRNSLYINKNLEKEYQRGAAADIEFIFGIAADDITAWEGMLAGEVSIDGIINEYYEHLKTIISKDNGDRLDRVIDKYKQSGINDFEAKKAALSDLQYKASIMHDCICLVKGGSKVRTFYWDVKGDVEKLTANGASMVTAILGNMDIAEQMGYLHDSNTTEIMHAFMDKFIHGKPLELHNHEVSGVSQMSWDRFDADKWNVLNVKNGIIQMSDNIFSAEIKELEPIMTELF